MWILQNTLNFTTPDSTYYSNNGHSYLLDKVLVGTLGDYQPGTTYEEKFPEINEFNTNYPDCAYLTNSQPANDSSETVKYSFDTTAYYELSPIEGLCISVVTNATDIAHESLSNPGYFGTLKDTDYAIFELFIDPDIPENELPNNFVTWIGGEAVAGYQLRRKVSRSEATNHVLIAECSGSSCVANVYVVWCEGSGFKPSAPGTTWVTNNYHFPDNCVSMDSGVGIKPMNPNTGAADNFCEIEFTVKPSAMITDGNNGLFDKAKVKFDVRRDIKAKYWFRTETNFFHSIFRSELDVIKPELGPNADVTWRCDDFDPAKLLNTDALNYAMDDEDNNPWNGNGHLYGNDGPGFLDSWYTNYCSYWQWDEYSYWTKIVDPQTDLMENGGVQKLNFREWVRCVFTDDNIFTNSIQLMNEAEEEGTLCSEGFSWHSFVGVVSNETGLARCLTNISENVIVSNNVFWGTTPE